MHAICDNLNLGQDLSNPLCPLVVHVTTTPKPLSAFEVALYYAIKHGIDDRLDASRAKGVTPEKAKPIFSVQVCLQHCVCLGLARW